MKYTPSTQPKADSDRGYTLVEVMIVMVVSAALFVSAVLAVQGRQGRTQFAQGLRDVDSRIQDIINDVSTGFYPNNGGFSCTVASVGGAIRFEDTDNSAGTNDQCVFIGKVVQFAEAGTSREGYNVFTVVGRRLRQTTNGPVEVNSLADALPKAVDPLATGFNVSPPDKADLTQRNLLQWGLRVTSVKNAANEDISAIGFFGSLAQLGGSSGTDVVSGSQQVSMAVALGAIERPRADIVRWIEDDLKDEEAQARLKAAGGVKICFESGTSDQKGSITIGEQGRQLTTSIDQAGGDC